MEKPWKSDCRKAEHEHVLWLVARDGEVLLEPIVALQHEGVEDLRLERLGQRRGHRRRPRHHVRVPVHPVHLWE